MTDFNQRRRLADSPEGRVLDGMPRPSTRASAFDAPRESIPR
jgi:hypothetical protein